MITLTCDKCDKAFEIEDDAAGEKASCPYCGNVTRVPVAGVPAPAPRPQPAVVSPAASAQPASEKNVGTEAEFPVLTVRHAMFRAHPYWYLLMLLVLLGGLAIAVLSQTMNKPGWNSNATFMTGMIIAGIGFVWWLGWWGAPHRWVKLTITNKRVIRREGIFVHTTNEIMHKDILDIVVRQGFLERLLNAGYIGIDSAGQGTRRAVAAEEDDVAHSHIEIEMHHIPRPMRVKDTINRYRLNK